MSFDFDQMIKTKMEKHLEEYNKIYNRKYIVKLIKNPDDWYVIDLEKNMYRFYYPGDSYNSTSSIQKLIENITGKKIKNFKMCHELREGCFVSKAVKYFEITFENNEVSIS